MENNRYKITGTITEIYEINAVSQYFRKREFKLKISDTDFTGKIMERIMKFAFVMDNCELLNYAKVGDVVDLKFYIEGRDYIKDNKNLNFTSNIAYELLIINSPSRTTTEDRNAVLTNDGLVYKDPVKEATVEDLIRSGSFLIDADDPLNPKPKTEPAPISYVVTAGTKQELNIEDDLPF